MERGSGYCAGRNGVVEGSEGKIEDVEACRRRRSLKVAAKMSCHKVSRSTRSREDKHLQFKGPRGSSCELGSTTERAIAGDGGLLRR